MTNQQITSVEPVGTPRACPQCQRPADGPGRYCAFCGSPLSRTDGEPADGTVARRRLETGVGNIPTAPVVPGQTAPRLPIGTPPATVAPASGRRRRLRPWYRRRLFLAPVVLALLLTMGALAVGWRVTSSVSTIHQVSTPAPLVSGDRLGGDAKMTIDTGPAQAAIRSVPQGDPRGGVGNTIAGLTGGAAVAAGLQEETPPRTMNILLIGVDVRPGEAIDVGVRPDALAVLHLDADTGSCRMLDIPEDSRIELPGYGLSKASHALAVGNIPYQQQVVAQFLDITIDHYGLIDFAGIERLVDTVGGVTIEVPESFSAGDTTFVSGTQTLDGKRALLYARYRGEGDGALGKIGRQQQILRAVLRSASTSNPIALVPKMLPILEDHTRTSFDPAEMIDIATHFRSTCSEQTLETRRMSGTVATFPDPLLDLDLSYVIVDDAEVRKQVAWLLGNQPAGSPSTRSGILDHELIIERRPA